MDQPGARPDQQASDRASSQLASAVILAGKAWAGQVADRALLDREPLSHQASCAEGAHLEDRRVVDLVGVRVVDHLGDRSYPVVAGAFPVVPGVLGAFLVASASYYTLSGSVIFKQSYSLKPDDGITPIIRFFVCP